jgi:hypothetical protein
LTAVAALALGVSTACGGVTTVARSERAAVGWGILSADYCLEPINSADQAGGPLILGSDASAGQSDYGLNSRASRSAHGREIAEIMLFARESLYRICEALQNGDLKPAQAAAERRLVFALAAELIEKANQHEVKVLETIEQAAPPGPPRRTR